MEQLADIDPLIAFGVIVATMLTDALCVLHTSSVAQRQDLAAANWGALTYMLSAVAVISFTSNWAYVLFAALGSWIGAYGTMKILRWRSAHGAGVVRRDAEGSPLQATDGNGVHRLQPLPSSAPDPRLAA